MNDEQHINTSLSELAKTVNALSNSVKDLIKEVRNSNYYTKQGIESTDKKLDTFEARLSQKIEGITSRLEHEQITRRVDVIETKLAAHEKK